MDIKYEDQIKMLMFVLVAIIAILLIILIALNISSLEKFFGSNKLISNVETNYNQTSSITKINTNEKALIGEEVSDILIEQKRLINVAGTSILTTKVTNKGLIKDNVRFKIKFLNYDSSTSLELMGYVGRIKTNETKYIDSYISKNLSDLKNIIYELMD